MFSVVLPEEVYDLIFKNIGIFQYIVNISLNSLLSCLGAIVSIALDCSIQLWTSYPQAS